MGKTQNYNNFNGHKAQHHYGIMFSISLHFKAKIIIIIITEIKLQALCKLCTPLEFRKFQAHYFLIYKR